MSQMEKENKETEEEIFMNQIDIIINKKENEEINKFYLIVL